MGIYFSTGAFSGSLPEILDSCEAEGLPGLELSSGLPFSPDLARQASAAADRDIAFLVHNYFPPPKDPFVLNLASEDEVTLSKSLELCRIAIDLGAELGAPFYSVHSGFAMRLSAGELGNPGAQAELGKDRIADHSAALRIFRESVGIISEYARGRGLKILVENNVITKQQVAAGRAQTLLMTKPLEIRDFLDDLKDDNVGVLLDVGHAKISAEALDFAADDFFTVLSGKIQALHLSENDGIADSNLRFSVSAWFSRFLPGYCNLPLVIEVYRLDAAGRRKQLEVCEEMLA